MPQAYPIPATVKVLHPDMPARYAFSICTLMTRPDQYAQMVQSYRDAGFDGDCEYLCIDNSQGNVYDAFSGYNAFLVEAQGTFIILTHQDVELCFDNRRVLEEQLHALTGRDATWAACGNAGCGAVGELAMRISDPHGENRTFGNLPARVSTLDENFIVVRRAANLCLSSNLSGYHMYGPDLCTMADVKGDSCYVINFHLRHLSAGTLDDSFRTSAAAFARKYASAFRSRWVHTTVTTTFLSGSDTLRALAATRIGRMLVRRRR